MGIIIAQHHHPDNHPGNLESNRFAAALWVESFCLFLDGGHERIKLFIRYRKEVRTELPIYESVGGGEYTVVDTGVDRRDIRANLKRGILLCFSLLRSSLANKKK